MRYLACLLVSLVAACQSTPARRDAAGRTLAAWIELGPGGIPIARVITKGAKGALCPDLSADGSPIVMSVRQKAAGDAFPILTCESQLPSDADSVEAAGEKLARVASEPKRVVVLGDTGCRLKKARGRTRMQACNDPAAWPFAKVAAAAAKEKPDLVIHVGDYVYREARCPDGDKSCEGSPAGHDWDTWAADFFTPARELLAAAPWVFVRGNHETCRRAGYGWFSFLDPRPVPDLCTDGTEPYWVRRGAVGIAVLDSAGAEDAKPSAAAVTRFRSQLDKIAAFPLTKSWLATHRPVWAAREEGELLNATLQEAHQGGGFPANLSVVLAGHIHAFQRLEFEDGGAVQIVAGNGGTALDRNWSGPRAGLKIGARVVKRFESLAGFGYLLLEKKGDGWKGTVHDDTGKRVESLDFTI